jgi:hypothetical protein
MLLPPHARPAGIAFALLLAAAGVTSTVAVADQSCAVPTASAGGAWPDALVPNAWGRDHFRAATRDLDACYARAGASKRLCDEDLHAKLLDACASVFTPRSSAYGSCATLASRYRMAASSEDGDRAFDAAQACASGLAIDQQPSVLDPGRAEQVIIRAKDASGAELSGEVMIDGAKVGDLGRPFALTPRFAVLSVGPHHFFEAPALAVVAAGHPRAGTMLEVKRPALAVHVSPPLDRLPPGALGLTVTATDGSTNRPVQGRVTLEGAPIGSTNQPFSYTSPRPSAVPFGIANMQGGEISHARCPDLWIVADGYPDTPVGGNDCLP